MTPKKGRGIGAYLLVVVVLIVALVFLLNGLKTGGKETKYSDIMKYFDNYEVTAYTLDLGSGELKLTLDDGDKLTYDVPNVSVFRDDTKDYRTSYNQKHPDAPLQVDYYKIRDTSWLLTLLALVLNVLSAMGTVTMGNVLFAVLIVVSSPMVCSGYWALSLFLWACLLIVSHSLLRKNFN